MLAPPNSVFGIFFIYMQEPPNGKNANCADGRQLRWRDYDSFFNIALAANSLISCQDKSSFAVFCKIEALVHISEHFFQFLKAFALRNIFGEAVKPADEKTVFRFKIGITHFLDILLQ